MQVFFWFRTYVHVFSNADIGCVQVFFCVCALFSMLSAAPAPEPQLAVGAAAVVAAAGVKAAIIAGIRLSVADTYSYRRCRGRRLRINYRHYM
jgi:hypothetical protein